MYLFLAGVGLRCGKQGLLCCGVQASYCGGFSCGARALESCRLLQLWLSGSNRISSCGLWAQLLCGTWDLPGPGVEPVSPALAGRFLTTRPPGKLKSTLHLLSHLVLTTKTRGWICRIHIHPFIKESEPAGIQIT